MNKAETKQKKKKKETNVTKKVIKIRLINHFKNHIGEENKTSLEEIFQAVMKVNSLSLDGFTRFYFWNNIEKMIRELRRNNECFIIKKNSCFFVLKELNESDYYKKVCDKAIKGMEKSKIRADEWVKNEKWRELKNVETEEVEEEVEEKETDEEKIEKIKEFKEIAKEKTKVIKMFENENNN